MPAVALRTLQEFASKTLDYLGNRRQGLLVPVVLNDGRWDGSGDQGD